MTMTEAGRVSGGSEAGFRWPAASVEATPRWVRVKMGGETIADSRSAWLLIQYGPGRLPTYYFPPADVRLDRLAEPAGAPASGPESTAGLAFRAVRAGAPASGPESTAGLAFRAVHAGAPASGPESTAGLAFRAVRAGGQTFENAAWIYAEPPAELAALRGCVSFHWNRATSWFEEDEQVFVHARDPHKRVDVLASSRHVQVLIDGQVVADSRRPHLLFETSLPTRYYLPPEDVRLDRLEPSAHTSRCPYKGKAAYWSARIGDQVRPDVAWSTPTRSLSARASRG